MIKIRNTKESFMDSWFVLFLKLFFEDKIDDAKYCGHLYGLGTSYANNGGQAYSGPNLQASWNYRRKSFH